MDLTLPAITPPSLQMVRILSQFFLNSAFSVREDDHAVLVFEFLDEDINLVADLDGLGCR